jgi:predicted dehydrogenase
MDRKRLDHMTSLYPMVEPCSDYDALVKRTDVDAVAIATPVRFHYEMAKKSLENGKHTFIEKPMATSTRECQELVNIAERKGLTLFIGHTFIYSAHVRKIREIVQSGALGDILYISARRLKLGLFQKDVNVAWDLAPHDIAIILHILGETPKSVCCQGKAHVRKEIEDVTNMTLNFESGVFATIQSSWLDPNKIRDMTFVGSKRMLLYNDMEPIEKIKIYDKRVETPPYYDTFAEFHYSYHHGDMYSPFVKQTEPLKVEAQHFQDCIINKTRPASSGYDGLDVVHILEAANLSLRNDGTRVDLTAPAEAIAV